MDRDIPVAERVKPTPLVPGPQKSIPWPWLLLIFAIFGVSLGLVWFLRQTSSPPVAAESSPPQNLATPPDLLGHLPYAEAPTSELTPISLDGSIKLRTAAAEEFLRMQDDAMKAGVALVPLSGFRSKLDQDYLFFDVKKERGQVPSERAQVSAPPGFSEHHTGYAVDIGTPVAPETHLQVSFENTAAFAWLRENAAYYSFELSFPQGNPQGISYEPWHWRYVGDEDSLRTFYQARQLNSSNNQPNSNQTHSSP